MTEPLHHIIIILFGIITEGGNRLLVKDSKDLLKKVKAVALDLMNNSRLFTTDVKLLLFDSYCTSLYCLFLRTDYTKRTFSKFRVEFNNAYRSN